MRVKVSCGGQLGTRCEPIELEVTSPLEIIALMEANYPGFRRQIIAGHYAMVAYNDDTEKPRATCIEDLDTGLLPVPEKNILFLPVPRGEAVATAWLASQILTYTAITSVGVAMTIATVVVAVGVALAIAAVADLMMPKVETEDQGDNISGFSFSGPVNTVRQGNPVPICYGGPIRVGSQVISVAIASQDIPV